MTKAPLESKTIQGALIMFLTGLFSLLGIDYDQAHLTELLTAIAFIFGCIRTIYGRFKATGKISLNK